MDKAHAYLIRLATQAYANFHKQPSVLQLGVDENIAKKYTRFRFKFDPKSPPAGIQALFIEVFAGEIKHAKESEPKNPEAAKRVLNAIFAELKEAHPFGVEIWVNPANAGEEPLVENMGQLAVDSVLSAARTLLADLKRQQEQNPSTPRLQQRYRQTLQILEEEHKKVTVIINQIYTSSDAGKVQFKTAQKIVGDFQRLAVAQLTAFKHPDGAVTKENYKCVYAALSDYEQKREVLSDPLQRSFKHDIFSLDITQEEEKTHKIVAANFSSHKRHCTPTAQQLDLLGEKGDVCRERPTATAHTHDPLLPNYAAVKIGTYKDGKINIHLQTTRHGSPAPSEHQEDRHLAALQGLYNMEQVLQNHRTKAIEALLQEQKIPVNPYTLTFARLVGYEISAALHKYALSEQLLTPTDKQTVVKNAVAVVAKQIADEITPKIGNLDEDEVEKINQVTADLRTSAGLVQKHAEAIVNIKNIHTHLITGAGPGSMANRQGQQFDDAQIAAMATWMGTEKETNDVGYFYMCNGINWLRHVDVLTLDGEQRLEGNNCVGMIELYKQLPTLTKGSGLKNVDLSAYQKQMAAIKTLTKEYLYAVEANYLPFKKTCDAAVIDPSVEQKVVKDLNARREKINQLKLALHKEAGSANKAIYEELKTHADKIKSLATVPAQKDAYVAYQAYYEAQRLFNEKNSIGVPLWKLEENNGQMQALINLAAEHAGNFGSFGCKSNNDRAFVVATITTALAKLVSDVMSGITMYLDLTKLREMAQEKYAIHISHVHTQLDGSAEPKVTLQGIEGQKQEKFIRYEALAAHQRAKGKKTFELETMRKDSRRGLPPDESIYFDWRNNTRASQLPQIAEWLKVLCDNEDAEGKLEALRQISAEINAQCRDSSGGIIELANAIQSRACELRVQATQCDDVKNFLILMHKVLPKLPDASTEMQQALKLFIPEKAYSLPEVLNFYMELRKTAQPKAAGSSLWVQVGIFSAPEPVWMHELRQLLQRDISSPGFNVRELFNQTQHLAREVTRVIDSEAVATFEVSGGK